MNWLKRLASKLPRRAQQELKRLRFSRQLRAGTFATSEPEYSRLPDWIREGDWVLDIGANVGHYTIRMSQLVGTSGRVMAFEPVPETFELLAANVCAVGAHNVSLFNVAASERTAIVRLAMPRFASGLLNYYMASLTSTAKVACEPESELDVMSLAVDSLPLPGRVALVKIDVEGHELSVLRGMGGLLRRDRPRLIVEDASDAICEYLDAFGYDSLQIPRSPNRVFFAREPPRAG